MSKSNGMEFGSAVIGFVLIAVLIAVAYFLTAGTFVSVGGGTAGGEAAVAERLKPVGEVRVAEKGAAAVPAAPAAAAPTAPVAAASGGEATYSKVCFVCHGAGVAGAPKLGDKAAWEPRIAQGMDVLLNTALHGKGAMPPRGTCATCSDDDLKAAIEYMVSKAQ